MSAEQLDGCCQQREHPLANPSGHRLDQELVRLGRGEADAFDHIYAAVAGSVLGVARRILRDPSQAEEVTHEVLLEVWRKAGGYDPSRASARTWIMMLAHRRSVDRVRSSDKARQRDQRGLDRATSRASHDETVAQVEFNHDRQAVRDALGRLTSLQREAITLAYWGGHTYADVAVRLGIPTATAKTRIRDGLRGLRTHLVDRI